MGAWSDVNDVFDRSSPQPQSGASVYRSYCEHNNPIEYTICPGCRAARERRSEARYRDYRNRKTRTFTFVNSASTSEGALGVRAGDVFVDLKWAQSPRELRHAYYKLARRLHPDKAGGSTPLFQKLRQLYELRLAEFP